MKWLSDSWLEGHGAIDAMLQVIPGPPPPAPAALAVPSGGVRASQGELGALSPFAPERSAAVRK
jgi:hypothetical protein